jgi:hypothetical protein
MRTAAPVTMVFQNVNGTNDGQYYVSPYTGTMNGQMVTLFCDDVLNEVNFGQTWQANVTNLGTAIQNSDFFTNAIWRSSLFAGLRQCCSDLSGSCMAHHTIRIRPQQIYRSAICPVVPDESKPDQVRYRRSASLAGYGRGRLQLRQSKRFLGIGDDRRRRIIRWRSPGRCRNSWSLHRNPERSRWSLVPCSLL